MDVDHSLDRVIETLQTRFPELDAATVADCVHHTHRQLKRQATVDTHLATLTQRRASEVLATMGSAR